MHSNYWYIALRSNLGYSIFGWRPCIRIFRFALPSRYMNKFILTRTNLFP